MLLIIVLSEAFLKEKPKKLFLCFLFLCMHAPCEYHLQLYKRAYLHWNYVSFFIVLFACYSMYRINTCTKDAVSQGWCDLDHPMAYINLAANMLVQVRHTWTRILCYLDSIGLINLCKRTICPAHPNWSSPDLCSLHATIRLNSINLSFGQKVLQDFHPLPCMRCLIDQSNIPFLIEPSVFKDLTHIFIQLRSGMQWMNRILLVNLSTLNSC